MNLNRMTPNGSFLKQCLIPARGSLCLASVCVDRKVDPKIPERSAQSFSAIGRRTACAIVQVCAGAWATPSKENSTFVALIAYDLVQRPSDAGSGVAFGRAQRRPPAPESFRKRGSLACSALSSRGAAPTTREQDGRPSSARRKRSRRHSARRPRSRAALLAPRRRTPFRPSHER
jgi:hypothetical protein